MKVTLLLRYFTIGGLERVVSSLANAYVDRGIETQIIVLSKGKRNSLITELDKRIKITFLEGNVLQKMYQLRKYTKDNLVHIHFGDGKIHPLVRSMLTNRRVVVTYHSVYSHKRTIVLNWIDRFFAARVKKVIAVSDAVKNFCVNEVHIPANKVTVIKNGIEINEDKIKVKHRKILKIISLASLYPHKNQKYLFEALAKVKNQQNIPFQLYIIGDGPCMADLFALGEELGLRDNIVWYGAVWNKEIVRNIIKDSDLFVSASTYEGFPISILEGMVYGLPMLLSDIPPHREVGGDGSLYFKLNSNYRQFCNRMDRFYRDAELREKLSEYSYQHVNEFNITKTIDSYISVYKELNRNS